MSNLLDVVRIAQELLDELGPDGHLAIAQRAERFRHAGEHDAADLWTRVSRAMRELRDRKRPCDPAGQPAGPLPDRDVRRGFDQAPHAYVLLSPDLVIAGANDAYLRATMTRVEEILGSGLFEVFPDNPAHSNAEGARNLGASIARVLDTRKPDRMARQRYDIRNRAGVFEERWWEPLNSPVFDDQGRLSLILHHVRDVTGEVALPPDEALDRAA